MLFNELACFSPSVPEACWKGWVKNGGTLTYTREDFYNAKFFFCNGLDDPWLNRLLSRRLVVRHANWVLKCIAEGFRMPVGPYTLDDSFDPSETELPPPSDSLLSSRHGCGNAHRANPRKRPLANDPDTYFNADSKKRHRPPMKENEDDVGGKQTKIKTSLVSRPPCISAAPDQSARDQHQPEERRNQTGDAFHPELGDESSRAGMDDMTASTLFENTSAPNLEVFRSSFLPLKGPIITDLRVLNARKLSTNTSDIKYDLMPSDKKHAQNFSTGNGTLCLTLKPSMPGTTLAQPDETLSQSNSHSEFWRRTRQTYDGSGRLKLKMDEIVRARVNTKIFTPGDSCYGEVFGCVLRR